MMSSARWAIIALLWLQATLLNQATLGFQRSLTQFLGLRLALLMDPVRASLEHCAQRNPHETMAQPWTPCHIDLQWWRDRGEGHDTCADLAAGRVGLNLASPRRYRIQMTCTLPLPGVALRLPLLSTTIFR